MADETVRERALEFAFLAADECDNALGCLPLDEAVTKLLAAGDRIAAWLSRPVVARLVFTVGPVTEQPKE